jgi:hypothetical protein
MGSGGFGRSGASPAASKAGRTQLDQLYAAEVAAFRDLFAARASDRCTTTGCGPARPMSI